MRVSLLGGDGGRNAHRNNRPHRMSHRAAEGAAPWKRGGDSRRLDSVNTIPHSAVGGLHDSGDGGGHLFPFRTLDLQLLSAGRGELVVARAAFGGRGFPFAGDG